MPMIALSIVIGLLLLVWFVSRSPAPRLLPGIPYKKETTKAVRPDAEWDLINMCETGESWRQRLAWTYEIGTPIYQAFIRPGGAPWVVLNDPREIEDLTMRRNKEFDRVKEGTNTFSVIAPNATIAQNTTSEFKAQRRLWQDTMHPDFLNKVVVPNVGVAAMQLVELWKEKLSKVGTSPIDVQHDFSIAALDAIWVAILGESLGMTRAKLAHLKRTGEMDKGIVSGGINMEVTLNFMNTVGERIRNTFFPWYARWKIRNDPEYREFKRTKDEAINRLIRQSVTRYQRILDGTTDGEDLDTCAMDLVLRRQVLAAQKAGKPAIDPTKDKGLCDELFVLLWAGHETTSNTLSWFVKYVSNNTSAQSQLRAAIKSAVPLAGDSMPSVTEIINARIPYLDGAIEETLRLAGTAPVIVRDTMVDTEILGHKVPKGTYVLMNSSLVERPAPISEERRSPSSRAALQRSGYDWINMPCAEHLNVFAPERWLKKDAHGRDVFDSKALPQNAFGSGARGCFGKRLAILELRIMIVHIMWHFKLLDLPAEYNSMRANQGMLRQPVQCHVRLELL